MNKLQERVQQLEAQLQIEDNIESKLAAKAIGDDIEGLSDEARANKIALLKDKFNEEKFKNLAMKMR